MVELELLVMDEMSNAPTSRSLLWGWRSGSPTASPLSRPAHALRARGLM